MGNERKIRNLFIKHGTIIYNENGKKIIQIDNLFFEENMEQKIYNVRENFDILIEMKNLNTIKKNEDICFNFLKRLELIIDNKEKEKENIQLRKKYWEDLTQKRFQHQKIKNIYAKLKNYIFFEKNKEFVSTFDMALINAFDLDIVEDYNQNISYYENNFIKNHKRIHEKLEVLDKIQNIIKNKTIEEYLEQTKKILEDINKMTNNKYEYQLNKLSQEPEEIMDILNYLDDMFENQEE